MGQSKAAPGCQGMDAWIQHSLGQTQALASHSLPAHSGTLSPTPPQNAPPPHPPKTPVLAGNGYLNSPYTPFLRGTSREAGTCLCTFNPSHVVQTRDLRQPNPWLGFCSKCLMWPLALQPDFILFFDSDSGFPKHVPHGEGKMCGLIQLILHLFSRYLSCDKVGILLVIKDWTSTLNLQNTGHEVPPLIFSFYSGLFRHTKHKTHTSALAWKGI